ncbi:MAG: PQQ-binding-like beta-propeller repeat protein [Verrucomicrobiales bacterium]|nr:PQQ-binding-like beta-propeller repeat protein [Verrucomicrobiales bacterium]
MRCSILNGRMLFVSVLCQIGFPCLGDWPQFRGPEGDGIACGSKPPVAWSETENVRWKTPIPGKGWASPVILDGRIWIATATEDGRELSILEVDAKSGAINRNRKLFDVANPQFCHKFNSYASPTPVAESGRVYVTFGSPGTACLDAATGNVLWERRDFECNHYRGAGSSPILHGDLLILHFDGSDHQFVAALDKKSGKTVWQAKRSVDFQDLGPDGKPMTEGDFRKAFATPHVVQIDGQPVLLSQGAKALYAYEPLTGIELWQVAERQNHSASTRPVFGEGLIFVPSGFSQGQLLAIRPGKKGEVLDANGEPPSGSQLQIVWKSKRGIPKKPSLILHEGLLFGIEDGGVATCWDAKSGDVVWNERLGGNHSSSPLLADGRIYFLTEEGKAVVVAAGREFKKLAENTLGDGFMASPAVDGNALILRSRTHLYRVGG